MQNKKLFTTPILAFGTFFLAAVFWAYHRLNPLLFNPIDGDFQTFNPITRLLAGQFPYHDFVNYLGVGPLLLTTLAALPTGPTFAGSIATTDILASLAFLYMATTAFRLLGVRKPWLFAIALYLLGRSAFYLDMLPISRFGFSFKFFMMQLTSYMGLKSLVLPGHSLMPIRVLWPFLAVVPLIRYLREATIRSATILGGALGAGILWSNDYGPMSAVSFGLVAILAGRNLRHFGVAILAAILAGIVVVTAVTGGHPGDWLRFNMAVSQDQFWYYYFPDRKLASLDMVDLNEGTWALLLVLVVGIGVAQQVKRNPTPEFIGFAAIFLSTVLASLLSMLGSAWFSYYLSGALFMSVAFLIAQGVPWIFARIDPDGPVLKVAFGMLGALFLTGLILHPAYKPQSRDEITLGAKLDRHYDGFDTMMAAVRNHDSSVWSTYSTAVEAALHTHQPTGQDYIIHALGVAGREKYLAGFNAAHPRIVLTPRPDKILWEAWSRIINWWFYRELLQDYVPVAHGPFWTVWTQRSQPRTAPVPVTCSLERTGSGSVAINIRGGSAAAGHVADVHFHYVAHAPRFSRLVLEVEDPWLAHQYMESMRQAGLGSSHFEGESSVGLPPDAGQWSIPVELDRDGNGRSVIYANRRSAAGASLAVSSCDAHDWVPEGIFDR